MGRGRGKTEESGQLEFGFDTPSPHIPRQLVLHRETAAEPVGLRAAVPDAATAEPAPVHDARGAIQDRADALWRHLTQATGVPIRLRITNNSSTMMSLRYHRDGKTALVGLHHMFLEAPADIWKALSAWVLKPKARAAGQKLEAFIAGNRHLIRNAPRRGTALRARGHVFDLDELYREVNADEFGGAVTAPITWGKMPNLRRRRSIRFGSYSPGENLIRIHPLLDQDFVPRFFVRYIVFHEMLHAHMGIDEAPGGRRLIHPPAFRAREAEYPDFERAVAWMDEPRNLRRLLGARRDTP